MFNRTKELDARVTELEDQVTTLIFRLKEVEQNKEDNFDRRKSAHTTKRKKAETKGLKRGKK